MRVDCRPALPTPAKRYGAAAADHGTIGQQFRTRRPGAAPRRGRSVIRARRAGRTAPPLGAAKCASRRRPVRGARRNVSTKERTPMNAPTDFRRRQGPPAGGLGERRLRRHRHDAADRRRAARRSLRPATGTSACSTSPPATATRRSPRRAAAATVTSTDYVSALLDRGAERARAERLDVDVPGRRRRGAAVRRRELRRGRVDVRRDVRARSCEGRGRDGARLPSRRPDRPRQLDARGLHRPAVQGAGQARAAAGRRAAAGAVGRRGAPARRCSASARPRSPSTPRIFNFRYRSAAHFIDVFRTWYGPVHKAFARARRPRRPRRSSATSPRCSTSSTVAGPGSLVVPSEYLEIVVTRR